MQLAYLLLITGLTISSVAIYYSVIGMAAIFAAAPISVYIMGTTLEVAKLVGASWLKANWERAPYFIKSYMMFAIIVLMMITSMGIFGFLSKAHLDQNMVSGDVVDKIALLDEKIKTQKDNLNAARLALLQMDVSVNETMARSTTEKGADRSYQIRKLQSKERNTLQNDLVVAQDAIAKLNEDRAPIAKDLRKVEAEVGPIKYIAALIYGDNPTQNILEKAVTWVIIMIVVVFDPLAIIMLVAAQMTFSWAKEDNKVVAKLQDDIPLGANLSDADMWEVYESDESYDAEYNEELPIEDITPVLVINAVETNNVDDVSNQSLKPIDFLYKEYALTKFADLTVNAEEEPELALFINRSKEKVRFNNYSPQQLNYFAERISELKKNSY